MLSTSSKAFLNAYLKVMREEPFKDNPQAYLEFLEHAEGVLVEAIFDTLERIERNDKQPGSSDNVPDEDRGVQGPDSPTGTVARSPVCGVNEGP